MNVETIENVKEEWKMCMEENDEVNLAIASLGDQAISEDEAAELEAEWNLLTQEVEDKKIATPKKFVETRKAVDENENADIFDVRALAAHLPTVLDHRDVEETEMEKVCKSQHPLQIKLI